MATTRFQVFIDDNFHYQDEDERYLAGSYRTYIKAERRCKRIVNESLAHLHEPGMTSAELNSRYTMFGEDPFIMPDGEGERFSARSYARERCTEICGAQ